MLCCVKFSVTPVKRTGSPTLPSSSKSTTKMIALYDYNPATTSPNSNADDELAFRSGDIIYVHGKMHDDGFYDGESDKGKKGLVPSNYLKHASSVDAQSKPTEGKASSPVVAQSKVSTSTSSSFDQSFSRAG
jgi:hypothetical protein